MKKGEWSFFGKDEKGLVAILPTVGVVIIRDMSVGSLLGGVSELVLTQDQFEVLVHSAKEGNLDIEDGENDNGATR